MSDQNLAFNQFVPLLVCVCASGASYWIYRNTMECIGDTLSKHQLKSKSKLLKTNNSYLSVLILHRRNFMFERETTKKATRSVEQ